MDNNNSDIIFTENLKQRTTMGTKSSNNTVTGVWPIINKNKLYNIKNEKN